jgi:hypothetical protein
VGAREAGQVPAWASLAALAAVGQGPINNGPTNNRLMIALILTFMVRLLLLVAIRCLRRGMRDNITAVSPNEFRAIWPKPLDKDAFIPHTTRAQ